VGCFASRFFYDGDMRFRYKLDTRDAVASSSFSDSSDNEGILGSDFPYSTQPGGKFSWTVSFQLLVP
jgi:hypothetical protein